jgi:hypothetical protein
MRDENDCITAYPTIIKAKIPPDPIIQSINRFMKMDLPGVIATSQDCCGGLKRRNFRMTYLLQNTGI